MIDFKEFQALTAELRTQVMDEVEAHEREFHGGEKCWGTRLGIVAFMAHSVGIDSALFVEYESVLFQMVKDYEDNCPCYQAH